MPTKEFLRSLVSAVKPSVGVEWGRGVGGARVRSRRRQIMELRASERVESKRGKRKGATE